MFTMTKLFSVVLLNEIKKVTVKSIFIVFGFFVETQVEKQVFGYLYKKVFT